MNDLHIRLISSGLEIQDHQVRAVASLLEAGCTVPFIARYRKEATGSLDEVPITAIRDRLQRLADLDQRRTAILRSLEENGHLTDELKKRVESAPSLATLEDIYLPFRPQKRTRAMVAREKGLEPLAQILLAQTGTDPQTAAVDCVDPARGVETTEDALSGARDIIAEIINEDPQARAKLRKLYFAKAVIHSRVAAGKVEEGAKYRDYFDWKEVAAKAPSHRILAMRRGEKEDILNLSIAPAEDEAMTVLEALFLRGGGDDAGQVKQAIVDSYRRLVSRGMETEIRLATKQRADLTAIKVFSDNLRELLLAPPLGSKTVMGIDPGYRTGCKTVCLDRQGNVQHNDTIFPHGSGKQQQAAAETIMRLVERFDIEAIAIGNGTAGRETETFVGNLKFERPIDIVLVNESGASIYSASSVARDEFPDFDLTVRGAISIGRRLMDPLSELVKIDPKSIGVGQYQHDVDQSALKQALDDTVISCVNSVGVDVNRASVQLLTYVSGLGPQLARNITVYREQNGPFINRESLRKVPRLGPKAFEQCAGFLRIDNSDNPLDASAVHPESYHIVTRMAADMHCAVNELIQNKAILEKIDIDRYVTPELGLPTLRDIIGELAKPGRDPREKFETVTFAKDIATIEDLKPGMKIPGIVTNVTAFGAFVDVGVHQDGLVHVSELADKFVKNPADIVRVQQKVDVTVMDVDLSRNRIALSMKTFPGAANQKSKPPVKPLRRSSAPRGSRPKKAPFNNPFVDLIDRKLNS